MLLRRSTDLCVCVCVCLSVCLSVCLWCPNYMQSLNGLSFKYSLHKCILIIVQLLWNNCIFVGMTPLTVLFGLCTCLSIVRLGSWMDGLIYQNDNLFKNQQSINVLYALVLVQSHSHVMFGELLQRSKLEAAREIHCKSGTLVLWKVWNSDS